MKYVFVAENQMRRCFHIRITKEDEEVASGNQDISAILQAFHPNDCKVVVRDPITLSSIEVYDLATLAALSLEYHSLHIAIRLHDWSPPKVTSERSVGFHAVRVAEEALKFLENFMSRKMPHVYRSVQRKVTEETHHRRGSAATSRRNVRVVLEVPDVDSMTGQDDANCHWLLANAYEVPVEARTSNTLHSTDTLPQCSSQTVTGSDTVLPDRPVEDVIRPGVIVPRDSVITQKKLQQVAIYEDIPDR